MRQRFQSNHIDYSGLMIWVRHGSSNGRCRNCSQMEMTTTTWENRKWDCRSIVLGNWLNHAAPLYRLRPIHCGETKLKIIVKSQIMAGYCLSVGMIWFNSMNQWRDSSSKAWAPFRLSFVFRCKFGETDNHSNKLWVQVSMRLFEAFIWKTLYSTNFNWLFMPDESTSISCNVYMISSYFVSLAPSHAATCGNQWKKLRLIL